MEIDPRKRVVVTGMGAVTPLGLNVEDSFKGLVEGRSGIKLMQPAVHQKINIAGTVEGFDPKIYFSPKDLRRIHRSAQFSTAAAAEALIDSGLLTPDTDLTSWNITLNGIKPENIGAKIGSGVAGLTYVPEMQDTIRDKGEDRISPVSTLLFLLERVATIPSRKYTLRGEATATVAACATGSKSIAEARNAIILGEADLMLAGGTEAALTQLGLASFDVMRALADPSKFNTPAEASRPFDNKAAGFVMGEGAGILLLERLDHAQNRGAKIYAEIISHANTSDAYDDTAPSGEGARRAMRKALANAEIEPDQVDYLNAHGTSTPTGDPEELDAIADVFGSHISRMYVSSTKSATGHLLGAAGGVEAVFCIKALQEGVIPPTLNLTNPIREGFNLVPNIAVHRPIEIAMSNSFGFGGINSVLIFRKFEN